MLSDEEKYAINTLEYVNRWRTNEDKYTLKALEAIDTVLNLIEKQSKEIEDQIEKRANQRQELATLNAKQIEFNKLVNTVNSYKGQFKKQQKEIKKQQKEIEELKKENVEIRDWKYVIDNPIDLDKLKELDLIKIKGKEYVSKDKIKAKIEELSNGTYDAKIVLQSLLEKE